MSNAAHIIRQQVLDITFHSRERAHGLQDELGELYNRKLLPLIEDIFTSVAGGRNIKLDKLEIDLGGIERENLEQELILRVKEQLRRALDKAVPLQVSKKNTVSERREANEIRLLEHYLLYGSYPWWVSSSERPAVADVLLSAITAYPSKVVTVLRSAGRKAWVRKRLALRFSEQQLEQVVRLLEPQHAQFIIDYSADLQQLHEKKPAVKAPAHEFREARWEFVLTYLLSERGTMFNTRSFVKSTIAQLAAKYSITYNELLTFLAAAVKSNDLPFSYRSSLPAMLTEIYNEHKEASAVVEVNSISQQGEQLQFPVLGYYLAHGSLPVDAKETQSSDLLRMFYHALAHKPAHTVKMVKSAARSQGAVKRIVSAFPDTLIIKLIYISEPSNAAFIIDYSQGLQKLQEKERVVKTSLGEFRKVKWELVLTHLFTERGSYFNTRIFVQDTLKQLAARYNMQYSELLAFLSAAINTTALPAGVRQTLPAIIHSLAEEQAGKKEALSVKTAEKRKEEHIVQQRDALSYFFSHGKLPWWYSEPQYPTAAHLAVMLIRFDAREVVKSLHASPSTAPHHIASSYPLKLVNRIITLLEPAHGNDIVTYLGSVQRLQQEKALVHPRPAVFINVVMEVTLTYLLVDRGSHFNTRSYIRYTLQKLAARFNIRYKDLLQRMGEVVPLLPASGAGGFTKVITELGEEELQNEPGEDAKASAVTESDNEAEDDHALEFAESISRWMKSKHGITFSFDDVKPGAKELFYFLLNGKWMDESIRHNADELVVKLMQKDRTKFREQLAAVLASPAMRQRIISSLPQGRIYELVGMLASGGFSFLSSYLKDLEIVLSEHSTLQGIPNRYRAWLLEYVLSAAGFTFNTPVRLTEYAFTRGFIQFMAEKEGRGFMQSLMAFEAALRKVIPEMVTQLPLLTARIRKGLEDERKKVELKEKKLKEQEELKKKEIQKKLLQEKKRIEEEKERKEQEEKRLMMEELEEPGDALYISNAGISLVAPYMQRYFEMLGLTANGKFLSDRAAARGVHLLQYLATGVEEDKGEHDLAFNKLLCGLATWWPVEPAGTLTDKERETTNQMLNAVLQNWSAMRSTTAAAFRESFLLRQGRLLNNEKHWTLTVEKKTFDVLLTNIPWSFSTIKFPWMEKVIYVEWK